MKTYTNPKLEIAKFDLESVVTESGVDTAKDAMDAWQDESSGRSFTSILYGDFKDVSITF